MILKGDGNLNPKLPTSNAPEAKIKTGELSGVSRYGSRASFAIALSNWRREKRIPIKKIAGDLGVSIATISMWESGKRFPGGYNLEILLEYTGLPPCKLFCIMADKCVPADCQLALPKLPSIRT